VASSPRAKLLAIMGLFALPMVASWIAYTFFQPQASANYGELITPPAQITTAAFQRADGAPFRFEELRGKWLLVVSDSGDCPAACEAKLTLVRQVRLMLGRNAARVVRVHVADDSRPVPPAKAAPFEGTVFIAPPAGMQQPLSAVNDRAHVYVTDPRGNVMLRFPAEAEPRRMLKDLERLLKASQIG
jgi:cytochrome oxidase Cu insertion factor (SCO1/SenC/PrrC family)